MRYLACMYEARRCINIFSCFEFLAFCTFMTFISIIVHCNTTLVNGKSDCDYNVYKERCWFECNEGYVPSVNDYKTCLGNGSWSGGNPVCYPRNCSSSPPSSTVQMFETSCVPHYKLGCATECRYGYSGVGGYYTCELFNAGYTWEHVKWVGETTCIPGTYVCMHA